MSNSILRLPTVRQRCGLSRTAIYNAIQRGEFPQQVELGIRSVGWLESEIDEWIACRAKKSNPKESQQ